MSDDIREVMPPTPFSPLKRAGGSSNRRGGSGGRGGAGGEKEGDQEALSQEQFETLSREVEAANEKLKSVGRKVRLRLVADAGAPLIEIALPDGDGGERVTRMVTPAEMSEWVRRLESGEGLLIDEKI